MPLRLVRLLAYIPTAVLWLALKLGFTPIAYLKLLKNFPFMHLHHIIFDQMIPRISNYWKRDEAFALVQQAGLQDIKIEWVNECSWTVMGTKKDAPDQA
jgi:hypothetical protein